MYPEAPRPCPMPAATGWCGAARRWRTRHWVGCPCIGCPTDRPCDWARHAGRPAGGALARQHALDRTQFGKPIAGFQAIRHRLADTLVAIEGAEATLRLPGIESPDLTAMLAKAAAGKAALTAAKHCQQVLGGIGFTEEHALQHHVKRALVLDGLLGSSRELTRRAGAGLRARGSAPRLAVL